MHEINDITKSKRTTMNIRRGTIERLKPFGKYGDTMDDVVNRVIDLASPKSIVKRKPIEVKVHHEVSEEKKILEG